MAFRVGQLVGKRGIGVSGRVVKFRGERALVSYGSHPSDHDWVAIADLEPVREIPVFGKRQDDADGNPRFYVSLDGPCDFLAGCPLGRSAMSIQNAQDDFARRIAVENPNLGAFQLTLRVRS